MDIKQPFYWNKICVCAPVITFFDIINSINDIYEVNDLTIFLV